LKVDCGLISPIMSSCAELELFLRGLDLGGLLQNCVDKKITLASLLQCTDEDLYQIGVVEKSVRKRILTALDDVHKHSWQAAPVHPSVHCTRRIKCSEAVGMLMNVKKHASYVVSIVAFVSDQIIADKNIVLSCPEGSGVDDLLSNADKTIKSVEFLFDEFLHLRSTMSKVCGLDEFEQPRLVISAVRRRRVRRPRRLIVTVGLAVAVLCGVVHFLSSS